MIPYMTQKQLGWLSYYFLRSITLPDYEATTTRGTPFNAPLFGAELWMQDNLNKETASDLITLIKEGGSQAGVTYLSKRGFHTKSL